MYTITEKDLTRVNNDVNGNPRYVLHFLALNDDYSEAVRIARRLIGGKKYRAKWYGGGIVFQSYDTKRDIEAVNNYVQECEV